MPVKVRPPDCPGPGPDEKLPFLDFHDAGKSQTTGNHVRAALPAFVPWTVDNIQLPPSGSNGLSRRSAPT